MHVVTRFAPSPTGFLHIGGVRTALFAWLWARKNKGTFILRIEDTDKEREVAGSIEHIQDSLQWLSIDWDYGPEKPGQFGSTIQSERLLTYKEAAMKLVEKGYAYPDPYTQEEIEVFRQKATEEKRPFLMREYRPATMEPWDGKKPLRFRVPKIKRYKWVDAVRGELEAGEEALDDFILIKGDGYPTYNFAHIIDDHNMGITHVFRADEFIASTPKYLSLYDALGIERPVFATLPPIMGPDGKKKLSKRDGAKDILDYKKEGYLPETMANFLALVGWNPGTEQELFSMSELMQAFTLDQIQNHGGAFNEEKLRWMNREHMLRMSSEKFADAVTEFLSPETAKGLRDKHVFNLVVPLMHERVHTFGEIAEMDAKGEWRYFAESPSYEAELLVPKGADRSSTKTRLEELLKRIKGVDTWSAESVKNAVWEYAEAEGKGNVLWPMRFALSGREKSPDPFTIASIIGKDETALRIKNALDALA